MGLTMFHQFDMLSRKVSSGFRREYRRLAVDLSLPQPTRVPFWLRCVSLFHRSVYYGMMMIRDPNLLDISLAPRPFLRLTVSELSCPAYAEFITYYQRGRSS